MRNLLLLATLLSTPAVPAPVAVSQGEDVTVTLHDEPCALTAVVDLPRRATWTEGGATLEGCYGVHSAGPVVLYFVDRSIALLPRSAFIPLSGA